MVNIDTISSDATGAALTVAATSAVAAAKAIRDWERGGDLDPIAQTALVAPEHGRTAIEAVVSDEDRASDLDDPETRRGRYAYAGWLMLLIGTEEHGEASDLGLAARLFRSAAAE